MTSKGVWSFQLVAKILTWYSFQQIRLTPSRGARSAERPRQHIWRQVREVRRFVAQPFLNKAAADYSRDNLVYITSSKLGYGLPLTISKVSIVLGSDNEGNRLYLTYGDEVMLKGVQKDKPDSVLTGLFE